MSVNICAEDGSIRDSVIESDAFTWPLDSNAMEDLRWYLEDYLRTPFGVYEDRGPYIENQLSRWGEAIFNSVFKTKLSYDAYRRLRTRKRKPRIIIRSPSALLLGLPWELMKDPNDSDALVLQTTLSRHVASTDADTSIRLNPVDAGLRVLMVISRPAGHADISYRMIARPLLERLDDIRGQIELEVLRPPTLAALRQRLSAAAAAGKPFHIVHFDGHGLSPAKTDKDTSSDPASSRPEGALIFETAHGRAHQVSASTLSEVIGASQVPVVVLNACRSGSLGMQLQAAVTTQLLGAGVSSVVGMAYNVYAVAAAEFMIGFYTSLFSGQRVSEAVASGRLQMSKHDRRPSPKGRLALTDWIVPVHYSRNDISFPGQVREASRSMSGQPESSVDNLTTVGSFVGRDRLFYDLEKSARTKHVINLYGPAGTGKTELAKAFGRWWRDTGGVDQPDWIFFHSFKPGVPSFGLDGVIDEIGLRMFGAGFARNDAAQRREAVEHAIQSNRMLLIWDNFETVRSMRDFSMTSPILDDDSDTEISDFLRQFIKNTRSTVIITSRSSERWLSEIARISVGGLTDEEAVEYADEILAAIPSADERRRSPTFGELLQWLSGHPLSMRVILPLLGSNEPLVLLEGLRGLTSLPVWSLGHDERATALLASLHYSLDQLGDNLSRPLVAIGLFETITDVSVLAEFSLTAGVPDRFTGLAEQDWHRILDAAEAVGLLTSRGDGLFQSHPALPAYLAQRWRSEDEASYDRERNAAMFIFLQALATRGRLIIDKLLLDDVGLATRTVGLQSRTIGRFFLYALERSLWTEARALIRLLNEYWLSRAQFEEIRSWSDLGFSALKRAVPDLALNTPAGELWLSLMTSKASRQRRMYQTEEAEQTCRQILAAAQPTSVIQEEAIGGALLQLGILATQRSSYQEACDWHRKALEVFRHLQDKRKLAIVYHALSIDEIYLDSLDDAERYSFDALALEEEIEDQQGIAASFHQLGMIAMYQEDWAATEERYLKGLSLHHEIDYQPGIAASNFQLALVAARRERYVEAEEYHLRSLRIKEHLRDRAGMGRSYSELGELAYRRGAFEEAEAWYLKSYDTSYQVGDKLQQARSLGKLSILADGRCDQAQALNWIVRSVSIFDDFNEPMNKEGREILRKLVNDFGFSAFEEHWNSVHETPVPSSIRDFLA